MKRILLVAMVMATVSTVGAQDYSSARVGPAADQLRRATMRLAERTSQDLMRGASNSRSDIQEALLAQQLDASAALLAEMVRNRRPSIELREATGELSELSRRAPALSSQNGLWRQVESAISDVTRELGWREPRQGPPPRPIVGRITWRGRVDDRVQLAIRGQTIETRTISGAASPDGIAAFTTPLPNNPVDVDVNKLSGRGEVRVLQQPSRTNDFTAVLEIYDSNPGAQEYRLEIVWR